MGRAAGAFLEHLRHGHLVPQATYGIAFLGSGLRQREYSISTGTG